MDPLGATHSYVEPPGFTNMIISTEDFPHTFCMIYPTMTVFDWPKVETDVIPALIAGRKSKRLLYYGFAPNKEGNSLICREAYKWMGMPSLPILPVLFQFRARLLTVE